MKIAFFFTVLAVLAISGFSQSTTMSPAEIRARELAQLLSGGSRAEARKYFEANYNTEIRQVPVERLVGFFSSLHDMSRGLEVHSVQDAKPNQVTLLVRHKLTGQWDGLVVAVEEKPPHRITSIGLRPGKAPEGESKRLTERDAAAEMDSFVKKLAEADVFSGSVLLAKDGKPVYKAAYGAANKDFNVPNRIDTKFNLGSMNKMFTGLAIAQLVERGKLSFDDPLSKFIPDFPDAQSAQKIRIKHLLSHTAGLGGYFSKRWNESSRAMVRTVDDMMRLAKQEEKLQFEPGSKWQYSNTGMLVAGKVIEIVSGQSYFDYIRDHITKPAGMTNTGCFELDRVNTNLAVGYDKQFTDGGVEFTNNIFEHVMRGGPQGGCYSTAEDLLLFDQALRAGKLVSAEMVKTITSPKAELNSLNYGYGFGVNPANGSIGHGGGFTGINSNLSMYLGSGWTAIVMSNYSRGAGPVQQRMDNIIAAIEAGSSTAASK